MDIRTGVLRRPKRNFVTCARLALGALCAVLGVVALAPHHAGAQNRLVNSEPGDGDTVETSPEQIVLEFAEPVGDTNSVAASCNSNPVTSLAQPVRSDDNRTLRVSVLQDLPQGTCVVSWNVSEANGQPGGQGEFTFDIASAPTTTEASDDETTATTTATTETPDEQTTGGGGDSDDVGDIGSDGAGLPLWIGRVLSILGLSVLFGALLLLAVAWPEGPEYVIAVRFIRTAWVVGLVGTIVYVAAATASATGESFGTSLNPVEWADLLDAGWPGRAALGRLLLAVACGWVAALPERAVEPATQFPSLALPALAVATIGLTRTGGDLPALGVAMGLIHAVTMAVWLGGVIFVSRIVLAGSGEEDLVHATRGFSRIAMPALAITVITGFVQLFRLDGGELFSESHGRVLLLKTVAVAGVVFIAMSLHQLVQARLSRARSLDAPMANQLRRAFGIDALIGVVVIGLTGWMLQFPPPNVDADTSDAGDQIVLPINDPEAGIELDVILRPGRVGRNDLVVKVYEPDTGLRGLSVTFEPPGRSRANTVTQAIPLVGRGMAITTGKGIPLTAAGSWRVEVSGTTDDGSISTPPRAFRLEARRRQGDDTDQSTTTTPTTTSSTTGGG